MEIVPLWLKELEKEILQKNQSPTLFSKESWLAEDLERTPKDWVDFLEYCKKQQTLAKEIATLGSQSGITYVHSSPEDFGAFQAYEITQQTWLDAEKISIPNNGVLVVDFTTDRPATINTGPVSFFVWGAFLTRQNDTLFLYPIGGPTVWEGYLHLFPVAIMPMASTLQLNDIYTKRNRSDSMTLLPDNPTAFQLAKWAGVSISQPIIHFLSKHKLKL